MQQAEIKFTAQGWSAIHGAFSSGDVLRCSAALAAHFVEQAHCAVYLQPPAEQAAAAPEQAAAPAAAPRRPRAKRATPDATGQAPAGEDAGGTDDPAAIEQQAQEPAAEAPAVPLDALLANHQA